MAQSVQFSKIAKKLNIDLSQFFDFFVRENRRFRLCVRLYYLQTTLWTYSTCLTSTYFQYNGKHYKQLHGTAMGSPVSVVVAEIFMQNIEEQALATYLELYVTLTTHSPPYTKTE